MNVGFVGMSHLGLNSAVAAAKRGATVVCFDESDRLISDLRIGKTDIKEPQLSELMQAHKAQLLFTSDMDDLSACDLVYVALDVATDDQGNSDLAPLNKLVSLTDECLPEQVILVVLSQIPPGYSRNLSLKPNRQYYYQVETLVFGDAINRAYKPERYIVGAQNPSEALAPQYKDFLSLYGCPILPMRYESAELCKISINCCLVASVTIANTLAEICENVGADWSEIVPALKLDRRIGPYSYLAPGLGIAGGNLERDLNTIQKLAAQYETDASVVDAYIGNSRYRKDWPIRTVKSLFPDLSSLKVAVWGLTYKIDTHSLKNSPSIRFIEALAKESDYQAIMACYDPMVQTDRVQSLPGRVVDSPMRACDGADILLVLTPWKIFSEQCLAEVAERMGGKLVLDPYGALDPVACEENNLIYQTLGRP